VYHDAGNLNFSFIAGEGRYDDAYQNALILETLKGFGIEAQVQGRNDFCVNGRKFSGTAWCRRGENRLRHGTLLISAKLADVARYLSPSAEKLAAHGVKSVRSRVCNLSELSSGLTVETLARALRVRFGEDRTFLPGASAAAAIEALRVKNASEDWLFGATPAHDTDAMDPEAGA
jgi:lipoate-protein ligase A